MENWTAIDLNPQTYRLLWRSPTFVTEIALRNDVVETAIAPESSQAILPFPKEGWIVKGLPEVEPIFNVA